MSFVDRARLAGWVLAVLAVARPALAQESVSYGSVSGRVTDELGGVITQAVVVARQLETHVVTTTSTDAGGRFRFAFLRVGPYEITVHVPGFTPAARRVVLHAGTAFDLPIGLTVAAVESAVTVTAETATLETARSQIAATVPRDEVRALPLNGRNILDVALLSPLVAPPNVGGGTQLFPETSAVPGVNLSVAGQRNLSNNFVVDGLSANDDAAGLSGISYGADAVEAVQVVTSGGQAEFGRALGGHINIVTRSGTNTRQLEFYDFVRDDSVTAANTLSGTKLPMHQSQYGVSGGGPLVRDRTFLFANLEFRRLDQSGLIRISDADVSTINDRLDAVAYPGPRVSTGQYPNPVDTTHALVKLDHHLSDGDHLSLRYSAYSAVSEHARGAGGTVAASASADLDNLDQSIAIGYVRATSSGTVVEARAQFAYGDLAAPPADPIGPSVSIAGVASFGTLSSSPTGRLGRTTQAAGTISKVAGPHAVRAGVDVLYNDVTITFPRAARGTYAFSSINTFLAGVYNIAGFSQTFGDTSVALTNPNLGVYLQDEWKLGDRVTLNAGTRYDLQFLETIDTDANNASYRLGLVWVPDAARRMVVRGSAGRFFDRVPLRALANALLSAGNTTDVATLRQINVSLSPAQAGAPTFPATLSEVVPTTTLVNLTTMDRAIKNAHSDQASVEVERELGPNRTISVGYQHLRGRGLIMQINQNVPACAAAVGFNSCRPNPAYANNNQYSSAGSSDYDALYASFQRRPGGWGAYRVSYTLSRALNNVGETFFASPIDPFDLSKDWGRSDSDRRNTFVALATASTPHRPAANIWDALAFNFDTSAFVQWYSALPFNVTTGTNTIQGTPARPMVDGTFIPRNAGVASSFVTVNLRVTRAFSLGRARIEGLVEVFNAFNRRNDLGRVTTFGTGQYPTSPAPNYGQVTVVGEPRSLQFGVRLRY